MLKNNLLICLICLLEINVAAQEANDSDRISGSFEVRGNFYQRDARIGAANFPQYERQLYGADAWLSLNYSNWGFDSGIRFDLFNNSALLNPQDSYTAQGIGRWFLQKKIDKLTISGGYLYDQIGSGIIFRAYEERALAIDNALFGVSAKYELNDNWRLKVFTGKQKQQFSTYNAILRGATVDAFIALGDSTTSVSMVPGIGFVGKTLDDATMREVVSALSTYHPTDSIAPKYNTYAFTFFNTLNINKLTWYIETAFKTNDVFFDPFAAKQQWTGEISQGKLVNRGGTVLYSSLSYATTGLGITLEAKRTQNFTFRASPFVSLNRGLLNFLLPMTRQNTYRLTARYNSATQELGEQAIQADIRYAPPSNKWGLGLNFSNITNLKDELLYREIHADANIKREKWTLNGGLQLQRYNQEVYEGKPKVPLVATFTPYLELTYKFTDAKALRTELQYMHTKQDYGSWIFALAEFSIAPNWIFTASDMYNVEPQKTAQPIHYPTLNIIYTHEAYRFSLSYIKQVEGVVCTGGVCRLEPAFSGIRLGINATF